MSDFVLEAGAILAGKYRIESVLGRGGMGIVAAAYHLQLEQRVAIKLMLPHAMDNPEAVARFLREARAAARISSEHVARVFDVGSLPSGEPYIAMEYLQGSDLAELLSKQGHFTAEEAVDYVLQACEALAEAHAAGIIHRDLKPSNLYLIKRVDGQRLIKVLDFGISKVTEGTGTQSEVSMTRSSALMGSPLYMSPEQMTSSKAVDARSDLWSLGVVLYEMLCGFRPFNGETLPQVCIEIASRPPSPLAERAPGLPPLLLAVVERCLQKDPEARYQTIAEFAHALSPLASPRARQSIDRISFVLAQGVNPREVAAQVRTAVPTLGPDSPSHTELASPRAPRTQATWAETGSAPPAKRQSRAGLWMAAATSTALLFGSAVWLVRRLPAAIEPPPKPAVPATVALGAISSRSDAHSAPPVQPNAGPTAQPLVVASNAVASVAPKAAAASAAVRIAASTLTSAAASTPPRRVAPSAAAKPSDSVALAKTPTPALATVAPAVTPAATASVVSKPLPPPIRSRL
ncbi:MAG TPA: protein kinase [Polyangiaceae bacterium]|nr:protein kinase [Polyangiaceae bacterium]